MAKKNNKPQKMSEEEVLEARKVREERDERKRVRDIQRKKARRKAVIRQMAIISIFTLVALGIILGIYFFVSEHQKANAILESYASGGASLTLRINGKFEARMHHGETHKGTYVKLDDDATIEFTYDGITVRGVITDGVFRVPTEWDDGHGHEIELPLMP